MAEGVQVFGDIAQSIRKRPGLWLAGGALAVGLGVWSLARDRARGEPVMEAPSPDEAPDSEALEGLAGSIQAQSQAILTAISQLSETQAQAQAQLLETLAAQQEAQLEAQTRFWTEFQQVQEQRQAQILQAFQQQSQALSEAISDIIEAIRERQEPPIEIPRSPEPRLLPVPYGPAVGYGLTWEPGEGPPPPTIEQIKSDPKVLARELERTRLVIENRRRLGMPTEDQERRLQTLLNLQRGQSRR